MVYLFDLLLAIGAIVLVLATVASASRNRSQRQAGRSPVRGIWIHPNRQTGHMRMPEAEVDKAEQVRSISAAGMQ